MKSLNFHKEQIKKRREISQDAWEYNENNMIRIWDD